MENHNTIIITINGVTFNKYPEQTYSRNYCQFSFSSFYSIGYKSLATLIVREKPIHVFSFSAKIGKHGVELESSIEWLNYN